MVVHASKTPDAQQILLSPDAAVYIGMSESWLRQSRTLGRTDGPPFLRVGSRSVRYLKSDLDCWLQQRRDTRSAASGTAETLNAAATNRTLRASRRLRRRHTAAS